MNLTRFAVVCLLGGCLAENPEYLSGVVEAPAESPDLGRAPDLAEVAPPDLAEAIDLSRPSDLAEAPSDLTGYTGDPSRVCAVVGANPSFKLCPRRGLSCAVCTDVAPVPCTFPVNLGGTRCVANCKGCP